LVLTLNNLAKEYGLLPSEALGRATTFDLYVLDVSTRWLSHRQDVAEGKVKAKEPKKQDLQWYMDLARREDSERKRKIAEKHNDQESSGS
jgi:hypothetical protein